MSTSFSGAWDKVHSWLTRAATGHLSAKLMRAAEGYGEAVRVKLLAHIQAQDLGWPPLAPSTVAKKGHEQAYVETGDLISNIRVELDQGRFHTTLKVFPSDATSRSGLTFRELATKLEYGTPTIPPRPVWRPTYDEVKRDPKWANILRFVTEDW